MYLHIGDGFFLKTSNIIAIIVWKGQFEINKANKSFLDQLRLQGKVRDYSTVINAKSMIISDDYIYISPVTPEGLAGRRKKGVPRGYQKNV